MRYLTLPEVLELHSRILQESGGGAGVRDIGALESSLSQPRATFSDQDL
jgi:death on curing protein